MAALTSGVPQSYIFSDPRGFKARTTMHFNSGYGTATLLRADCFQIAKDIHALSLSASVLDNDGSTAVIKSAGSYTTAEQPYVAATTGAYDSIADKLAIVLNDGQGKPHTFLIPMPNASVFRTDNKTADITVAILANLVSDMLFASTGGGTVTTTKPIVNAAGANMVSFVNAYRVSRKTPRRMFRSLKGADTTSPVWP